MSMTREEAIEELERLLRHWDDLENGKRCFWGYDNEAVALALSALRPVSREQVEKVWRGEWNYSHKTKIDGFDVVQCSKCGQDVLGVPIHCSRCGWGSDHADQRKWMEYNGHLFCGHCGAPMTDEAVQMVMERLEALKNES